MQPSTVRSGFGSELVYSRALPGSSRGELTVTAPGPRHTCRMFRTRRVVRNATDTTDSGPPSSKKLDPELLRSLLQDSSMMKQILDKKGFESATARYEEMKLKIFKQSLIGAGFLSLGYIAYEQYNAALVNLVAVVAGGLYFQMMAWEVERIDGKTKTLFSDIIKIPSKTSRRIAMSLAAYVQMAKPRFLIPIALAVGVTWFDAAFPNYAIGKENYVGIVTGFLAWKVPIYLMVLYDNIDQTAEGGQLQEKSQPPPTMPPRPGELDIYARRLSDVKKPPRGL